MKHEISTKKPLLVAALLVFAVAVSSWQFLDKKRGDSATNSSNNYWSAGDTSNPKQSAAPKNELKINGIESTLKELDIQLKSLDTQLQGLGIKIEKQINEAMASTDLEKISKEVESSLQKIDWDKMRVDIDKSLINAQEELKNVDMKAIEKEIQQMQFQLDSKEFHDQFNSEKINQQINDAMNQAKESIDKAKQELLQIKAFTDMLQKNGLIDKGKKYSIEWKDNGDLYINGEKQQKQVSDKYSQYYKPGGYLIKDDVRN